MPLATGAEPARLTMPLFSVIIPTYNRAAYLPTALASVFAQACTDFEIIVVDDGSTDTTPAMLAAYGNRIRVLRQANQGPGVARNLGATAARGIYLAYLDSDDLWFPWTLSVYAELIRRHNQPAILAGRLINFHDTSELEGIVRSKVRGEGFGDYLQSCGKGYFVGSGAAVLRKDLFLAAGGFTTERINCEDHDLILRLGTAPGFVQILDPVTLAWRRHAGSATMDWRKTYLGLVHLIAHERAGCYPGGKPRCRERWAIITSHTRPATLEILRNGARRHAWSLYIQTLAWNASISRWKYLLGFPLVLARSAAQ